ncbi:MAG TPA: plastocyanin/azurin family copper-binding protein [Actinomycetota bacterium]
MTEEGSTQDTKVVGGRTWRSWARLVLAGAAIVTLLGACTADDGSLSSSPSMQGGHMNGGMAPSTGAMTAGVARPAKVDVADRIVRVETLDQLTFDPPVIDVLVGETVAFEVTNPGATVHEFMLAPEAMRAHHGDQMGQSPGQMMTDQPFAVTLEPGETETIAMRFVGEGALEYGCHVPGHYEAGMVGTVTARNA